MTGGRLLLIWGQKVKVKFMLWKLHRLHTITPPPFDIQCKVMILNTFVHVMIMIQGGPLLIFGSKGQRSNSDWTLLPFRTKNYYWPDCKAIPAYFVCTVMILASCVACDLRSTLVELESRGQKRKKKRYDSISPVTKTPTPTEQFKKQRDNIKTPPKTLITQLLQTDLGRSVGVTVVTQLVWLNRFTSAQP